MEQQNGLPEQEEEEQLHKKRAFETGVVYSVAELLLVVASVILMIISLVAGSGFGSSEAGKYLSFLLPQVALALTAFIYLRRAKKPFVPELKRTFAVPKWQYLVFGVLLEFGLLFSVSELNTYFQLALEKIGYVPAEGVIPNLAGWRVLPAILVIALLPAIFEETVFRGIVTRNMREQGWGTAAAVLVSGALFSLYHGNPSQTVYQFICGACFALVAIKSGSLIPTVLMHFLNNAIILIISSVCNPIYGENWSLFQILPLGGYVALVVCSGLCFIASLVFLILFEKKSHVKGGIRHGKPFFTGASLGIVVCALQWILVLVERCGWLG